MQVRVCTHRESECAEHAAAGQACREAALHSGCRQCVRVTQHLVVCRQAAAHWPIDIHLGLGSQSVRKAQRPAVLGITYAAYGWYAALPAAGQIHVLWHNTGIRVNRLIVALPALPVVAIKAEWRAAACSSWL